MTEDYNKLLKRKYDGLDRAYEMLDMIDEKLAADPDRRWVTYWLPELLERYHKGTL